MKVDLNTARLDCARVNHSRLTGVELGVKSREHVDIPAPIAWYDIEKDGKNNNSPDRNIITDFSGNGRHLTAYNFNWGGMSGYGGHQMEWNKINVREIPKEEVHQKMILKSKTASWGSYDYSINIPSHKVSIKGLPSGARIIVNVFFDNTKDNLYGYRIDKNLITITEDGVYNIPGYAGRVKGAENYRYLLISPTSGSCNLTIEVLPEYTNALVFDGGDDYAEFVGDLGLNEYTVLLDRHFYDNFYPYSTYTLRAKPRNNPEDDFPFLMEYCGINGYCFTDSYGGKTEINKMRVGVREVSVQTSSSYNGKNILRGDSSDTGKGLCLGDRARLVFYKLLLFDRILTPEQIESAKLKYGFK